MIGAVAPTATEGTTALTSRIRGPVEERVCSRTFAPAKETLPVFRIMPLQVTRTAGEVCPPTMMAWNPSPESGSTCPKGRVGSFRETNISATRWGRLSRLVRGPAGGCITLLRHRRTPRSRHRSQAQAQGQAVAAAWVLGWA